VASMRSSGFTCFTLTAGGYGRRLGPGWESVTGGK
jgi:hypothetical protein